MLNRHNVLIRTNYGLDFFRFVIKDLQVFGTKCKNCKNILYEDTNASLSIFLKNFIWCFKDHGNDFYKGDVFDFAALYYNLDIKKDFQKILVNINRDLNLNLNNNQSMNERTKIEKQLHFIDKTEKTKAIEYQKTRKLTKHQHFKQSNAYKNFPEAVVFINHNKTGYERRYICTDEELKRRKLSKVQFFGVKENSIYISGYDKDKEQVIICEGTNNALSFVELGYSAISTFGASNIPKPEFLKQYIENKIVYLAGDGDQAGDKFNTDIALLIYKHKIQVKQLILIQFPDKTDANDLLIVDKLADFKNLCINVDFQQLEELYLRQKEENKSKDELINEIKSDEIQIPENFINPVVSLDELIDRAKKEPPIPFIWNGIKKKSFGFIFGASKSGKTILCENLGMALAAGLDSFLGHKIEKSNYLVLFISLEEFWQQRTERNEKQANKLSKDLMINYWIKNYLVINENCPRQIATEEDWQKIENIISRTKADVVFIDSLSRLYQGGIEDSKLAKEVAFRLREIADKYNITLIVIHHTPKQAGKPLTIDSLAGSRMLAQEADFMIGVGKSIDGQKYIKEIAFRYKPENTEEVMTITIDNDLWITNGLNISEATILKTDDGRQDDTNSTLILEFFSKKISNNNSEITTKDLMTKFVEDKTISKQTLFNNLNKLVSQKKIIQVRKGVYPKLK